MAKARGQIEEEVSMNKLGTLALALAASAFAALAAAPASAQSSGNFTYGTQTSNHNGSCSLSMGGAITGGEQCQTTCTINGAGVSSCTPQTGTCMGHAVAGIKTNSGSGNVFDVVVSAVIGLLTDVTVSSKQEGASTGAVSSSALAGANFQVTATDPSGHPVTNIIPPYPVTFDSRFIEISTNLFQALASQCAVIGLTTPLGCFITFNESTVSAHTYQYLIPQLTTGTYTITTTWQDTTAGTGISEALVCVSDVVETVQQNKVFHFNTIN
jgi:hypothetical protein